MSDSGSWTAGQVPDQTGRTVVVTGGNTGLGYQAALMLARRGATVVLACRNLTRASDAADRISAQAPPGRVSTLELDLASLASVHRAASELRSRHSRLDLLINNAGGIRPYGGRTEDGFELTLGTNHLGPFAFTGLVLDLLTSVPGSRVVTVSSIGHRRGELHRGDLNLGQGQRFTTAYFQSKLANLLFSYELQRRLAAASARTISVACHPGNARTEFGRELNPVLRLLMQRWMGWATWWLLQSPEVGALATVRAAVDPATRGGDFYGPPGRLQFTGHPTRVESSLASHDAEAQQWLWRESERLTGVDYPVAAGTAPTPLGWSG